MNAALWSQGVSTQDPADIVIDGVKSTYANTFEQNDVLAFLNVTPKNVLNQHGQGDKTSHEFYVAQGQNEIDGAPWVFIQGNYQNRDKIGRLRVFRFATRKKSADEIITVLKEYSNLISCQLFEEDVSKIEKLIKKGAKRNPIKKNNKSLKIKIILCVTIIVIAAISLTVIMSQK